MLKSCSEKGWLCVSECSVMAEKEGWDKGFCVRTEMPLCSLNLCARFLLFSPMYRDLHPEQVNWYIMLEMSLVGMLSLNLKKDEMGKEFVKNINFVSGYCDLSIEVSFFLMV